MSPTRAELRVYFKSDGGFARAFKLVIDQKGNVYGMQQAWPMKVKHSYHAGGYTKSTMTGVKPKDLELDSGRPSRLPLSAVKDFVHVTGTNMGGPPDVEDGLVPKKNSKKAGRRSIVIPAPPFMWGIDVWAVAPERQDRVARLVETAPYALSHVSESFVVDWLDPLMVLVAWEATSEDAYQIYKISPPPPGQLPYIHTPRPYEGTWLEPELEKASHS